MERMTLELRSVTDMAEETQGNTILSTKAKETAGFPFCWIVGELVRGSERGTKIGSSVCISML